MTKREYLELKEQQMLTIPTMGYLLQVVVLLAVVSSGLAAVFMEPLKTEIVLGKTVKYCEYQGIRFLPNSRWKDESTCARCVCRRGFGLECATMFGLVFTTEASECMVIQVRCKNVWVLRSNPMLRCPEGMKPPAHRRTPK